MQKVISIIILLFFLFISCSLLHNHQPITEKQQKKIAFITELIYKGDFKDAQAELLSLKNDKIESPQLYFLLGFIEEKLNKNLKKSIRYYKKGLTLLKHTTTNAPLLEVKLSFYLSYDYTQLKNKKLSQLYMNNTLSILEQMNKQNKLNDNLGYYFLAYCYNNHKNADLAIQMYKKVIIWLTENHPDYFYLPGAYFNTGLIYYNQSDLKKAIQYWQKAYDLEPDDGYYKNIYYQWLVIAQESLKENEK